MVFIFVYMNEIMNEFKDAEKMQKMAYRLMNLQQAELDLIAEMLIEQKAIVNYSRDFEKEYKAIKEEMNSINQEIKRLTEKFAENMANSLINKIRPKVK